MVHGGGSNASESTFPKCPMYGSNHVGSCLICVGACYACGKIGLKISNCPNHAIKGRKGHTQV